MSALETSLIPAGRLEEGQEFRPRRHEIWRIVEVVEFDGESVEITDTNGAGFRFHVEQTVEIVP